MGQICKHCGVELGPNMDKCPLCGNSPGKDENITEKDNLTKGVNQEKRAKTLWEAFSVLTISIIAFTILINLIIDKRLSWSLYVAGSVFSAWGYYSLFIFSRFKLIVWVPSALLITLGNLLLIDGLSTGFTWFFQLELPITTSFFILLGSLKYRIDHAKYHGFNILGFALLHIIVLCLIVETFIRIAQPGAYTMNWSIYVATAGTPVAIILLFIHYRLKQGNDLKSFFHI